MSHKQDVPPSVEVSKPLRDVLGNKPSIVVEEPGGACVYDIYTWSPGEPGSGAPPTQVHLVFPMPQNAARLITEKGPPEGGQLLLRLKSARALDELVGVLLEYRARVWGPGDRTG